MHYLERIAFGTYCVWKYTVVESHDKTSRIGYMSNDNGEEQRHCWQKAFFFSKNAVDRQQAAVLVFCSQRSSSFTRGSFTLNFFI